jgi:hypothetical protein
MKGETWIGSIRVLNLSLVRGVDRDPRLIYCGRAMPPRFPRESEWANQFRWKEHGVNCGPMFAEDLFRRIRANTGELALRISVMLGGMWLGCWCIGAGPEPHRCHAELLALVAMGESKVLIDALDPKWWLTVPPAGERQGRLL